MYTVKIVWEDGFVNELKNLTFEKAQQWAAYYNAKATEPEVQGLIAVSIIEA